MEIWAAISAITSSELTAHNAVARDTSYYLNTPHVAYVAQTLNYLGSK